MKTKNLHFAQVLFFIFLQYNIALCSISILSHTPTKNALNVAPSVNIVVQFNDSINTSTLTNINIRVNGTQSGLHSSVFTYNTSTKTVTVNPNSDFKLGETVEVTITQRVKSISNDSLSKPLVWRFSILVLLGFSSYTKDTSFPMNNPIGGIFCDIDNDGYLDEVISSHDNGIINIYKNNGNGKFSYSSTLSGGGLASTTYPPVCGDFNADGYIDIAVPVRFSNLVSVWFNNGSGTFSSAQQLGTDAEPDRINVSDYNGDGYLDFAVRCHSSSSYYINIFINDKTGHFTRTQRFPLSARLHIQCSGDLDGDGDIDIAVVTHDANLHVLFNNGNGVFTETLSVVPLIHDYMVMGDIDGDGDLDIVVNAPNGFVTVKNNGLGVFIKTQLLGSSSNSYGFKVLRDLDGDGDLDLIVPNWTLNQEEIYFNDGSGNFTLGYTIPGWRSNGAYEIDAGDINGNGNLDLAGPDAGSFVVYRAILPLPATPVLVSPVNGSIGIALTPLMDWTDVSGASSYRIQISTNAGFSSVVLDTSGISSSQINVPSGKLNGSIIYHWRVNASNSAGTGSWSTIWTFTTSGLPGIPVLVSPLNNSINISLTPTLMWNSVPTVTNYKLQLSIDSSFSSLILSDSTLTQNYCFIQSGLLLPNTKYYWRVNVSNSAGTGSWSTIWAFTTLGFPGAPVLVSPLNNSNNISLTPTLIWNSISAVINYRLQLSVDSNFTSFVLLDSILTQNYRFIQSGLLSNNTKYYWRVSAKNSYGWGAYSTIWNFKTELISVIQNYNGGLPEVFKVYDNFPNPFNPVTKIRFDLPKNSKIKINIYDLNGREISQPVNSNLKAGYYEVLWDASGLASGIYFCQLSVDNIQYTIKRMVLIK